MPSLTVRLRERQVAFTQIMKAETRIGRDPLSDVVIDNPAVSRLHAAVRVEGNDLVVVDCGSANGLLVNGTATKWQALKHGDIIQIGKFQITYDAGGSPSLADLAKLKPDSESVSRDTINPEGTVLISTDDIQKMARTYDPEVGSLVQATAKPPRRAPATSTLVMPKAEPSNRRLIFIMGGVIALLLIVIVVLFAAKK